MVGLSTHLSRRELFVKTALGVGAAAILPSSRSMATTSTPPKVAGRLKQSVCRWPYEKIPLDEFAKKLADMGIQGVDLLDPKDWPVVKKYGLVPTIGYSAGTIEDACNRKDLHEKLMHDFKEAIPRAAAAGVPNVITFSGTRKGMRDDEGLQNTVAVLNQAKAIAERHGVTICMELLNSKVDHKDYMFDHMAWGVEVMKRVNSPRVKILYDIYHAQIMDGDIIRTIRDNIQYIGHFHTGGNPGRNELDDTQELNYRAIAQAIADTGYKGFIGHEFMPKGDPMKAIRQAADIFNV